MVAIISHPSAWILDILGDQAGLDFLDTRRKANATGFPDWDTEICCSLDQLFLPCLTVSTL